MKKVILAMIMFVTVSAFANDEQYTTTDVAFSIKSVLDKGDNKEAENNGVAYAGVRITAGKIDIKFQYGQTLLHFYAHTLGGLSVELNCRG